MSPAGIIPAPSQTCLQSRVGIWNYLGRKDWILPAAADSRIRPRPAGSLADASAATAPDGGIVRSPRLASGHNGPDDSAK